MEELVNSELINLVNEANDSYKILVKYIGSMDSHANLVLLKWPDVIISYLNGDMRNCKSDISEIIIKPLIILAKSLSFRCNELKINGNYVDEINNINYDDILASKRNLIRICDMMIYNLRNNGVKIEFLRDTK